MKKRVRVGLIGCRDVIWRIYAASFSQIQGLIEVSLLDDPIQENLDQVGEISDIPLS